MRLVFNFAAMGMAASILLASAPAEAKICKDAVTAKARSSAQLSDANRERRAQEKAISNWSRRAADTYGWAFRFWRSAEEKQVNCGGGANSKNCAVSAKPCRLY
jgi:hypothetical protein